MNTRPIPAEAVDLVRHFEGLRLKAYKCPAGVWTCGYGATGKDITPSTAWTADQAEARLQRDLAAAAAEVDRLVSAPITDYERGALAAFVFNIGSGAFAASTMLKRINRGEIDAAAAEFGKWTKATVGGEKVTLPGLVKRRAAEAALFLEHADDSMPQAVAPPAEMKPAAKSVTVQAGGLGLGAAGVVAALDQARDVSVAARSVLDSLPPGGAGWVIAGILAVAVGVMLYRRFHDVAVAT